MIKYYGGKTWLPKYLEKNLPKDNNIETFIDLFVGGGSVSDFLSTKYKNGICNDLDSNLMNFYWVAHNRTNELYDYILRVHRMCTIRIYTIGYMSLIIHINYYNILIITGTFCP